ncbi:MAG: DHH family phosphoesterase [Oscillospiraceae bacterium]|nr:DHH family phosphoesterase [Oscillospiraceae bacterium]
MKKLPQNEQRKVNVTMNKKLPKLLQPGVRLHFLLLFVLLIIFAVVSYFLGGYGKIAAAAQAVAIVFAAVYIIYSTKRHTERLRKYLVSLTDSMDLTVRTTPLPVLIYNSQTGVVVWSNDRFDRLIGDDGGGKSFFERNITDIIPDYSWDWLLDGRSECEEPVPIGEKLYWVYGSIMLSERQYIAMTFWIDVTEYTQICRSYVDSRLVFVLLTLDNYDELLKDLSAKDKSLLLSEIDEKISAWITGKDGYLCKYDRDRYFFLFEERFLEDTVKDNFSILEDVGSCTGTGGACATLSIGIGKDGVSPQESYRFATLGMEMALSRGGNQAVVRNRYGFEFYGGKPQPIERRTKVKARVMANAFGELLNDASKVFVMGHKGADYDSIGAAAGVCCMARAKSTAVRIIIGEAERAVQKDYISSFMQHPEYNGVFISEQDAILEADKNTLLVIVDTNRPDQVESNSLLLSCTRIAVIDHHRRAADYIENAVLNFHEPYASSSSELVSEMMQHLVDRGDILRIEADALLAGIVLDTKGFTMNTGGGTFDAAAYLKRAGADASAVKRLLQSEFDIVSARSSLVRNAEIYKDGIAIAIGGDSQSRTSIAQAADELLEIKGVRASFAAAKADNTVYISGRSISDVNVQVILEKLGGGGSAAAAGVQAKNREIDEVEQELKSAIDEYVKKHGKKN